jgi:uncharacterized protein (DUF1800 family)
MLIWLDSRRNRKAAPNENYARELMELFSMGVGTFSEQDVREAARAFTGWFLQKEGFVFRAAEHDFGAKTFLGRTGAFNGDDVVDIILQQPVTGEYMARRLFRFFVHNEPDPAFIQALARIFQESGYSIKAMVRHILTSEEFYSPRAHRAQIKSPVDLAAGAVRSLGAETNGQFPSRLAAQWGQELFNPPDVSGWPGGIAWINSTTLLLRLNFAQLLTAPGAARRDPDTRQAFAAGGLKEPQTAADHLITLLLDGRMAREEQDVLRAYLGALGVTRPWDFLSDGALRGLAYLVLASPDYQLA